MKYNKIYLQQYALKDLGFDPGTLDGIDGKNTQSAYDAWQKSLNSENFILSFQEQRWVDATIHASRISEIDKAIDIYKKNIDTYKKIENLRVGGVPSYVIFVLHGRESTWNFNRHLHEGSPLTGRTLYVPKGRPKKWNPPFTFIQSAEDALYLLKDLENGNRWGTLQDMLQNIEAYNGLGYQNYHPSVPSPYLWAGTSLYTKGKYVSDGKFDYNAVDKQLGCATILKRMEQLNLIQLPPFKNQA